MISRFLALFFLFNIAPITAQTSLNDGDRARILQQLEILTNRAQSKVDAKYRNAAQAFRSASSSNADAKAFYLKCVQKVNFEDKGKRHSEFREWKRKQAGKLKDTAFIAALRQQLLWLVLTLEAASEDPNLQSLGRKAESQMRSIINEGRKMAAYRGMLTAGAKSSVFAKAYEVDKVNPKNWPSGPLQIDQLYEQLLLPPVRNPFAIPALRSKWQQRIQDLGILAGSWNKQEQKKTIGIKKEHPKLVNWKKNTLPNLRWKMEIDVYKTGDQISAARAMLQHLNKYAKHKNYIKWLEEATKLLSYVSPGNEDETKDEDTSTLSEGLTGGNPAPVTE